MKVSGILLAAAALLPLLAGCLDPGPAASPTEPAPSSAVGPADLADGAFYAFPHAGGELVFAAAGNGSADIVLYGADDTRIGHIGVGAGQARGRFVLDGVQPGELVLHALSINGTLDLRSGGALIQAFRPLTLHYERHVLVERPTSLPGSLGLPGGSSVDETVDLALLRAPASLTVLARASYESVAITVTGRAGTIYTSQSGGIFLQGPGTFFGSLPGTERPENVRDGDLRAHVSAQGFEGLLILEAKSYSRAAALEGGAHASRDVPRFTYGVLPDQPVSFEVRLGAEAVYVWQERERGAPACDRTTTPATSSGGSSSTTSTMSSTSSSTSTTTSSGPGAAPPEDPCSGPIAHVALFGPNDERVATVTILPGKTMAVPTQGNAGTWVAVLLSGEATLGADRVPSDFELHPLDVQQTTAPSDAAGSDGSYGQARRDLEVAGVPFRIEPAELRGVGGLPSDPTFGLFGLSGCEAASASVLLDGETLGAWGYDIHRFGASTGVALDASTLLGDGRLELVHDDFGRGCERVGVTVHTYQR